MRGNCTGPLSPALRGASADPETGRIRLQPKAFLVDAAAKSLPSPFFSCPNGQIRELRPLVELYRHHEDGTQRLSEALQEPSDAAFEVISTFGLAVATARVEVAKRQAERAKRQAEIEAAARAAAQGGG